MENKISPLAVRPKKAFELIGVGRSTGYKLLESGEIKSFRVGRACLVPVQSIEEWMAKELGKQVEPER